MPSHPNEKDNLTTTAVIYKPGPHAAEYIVYIDDSRDYEAWKGDKSIALSRFVGDFAIFKSQTSGHTGQVGEVSKQEIETAFFGDDKNVKDKSVEAAIVIILTHGHAAPASFNSGHKLNKNPGRGLGDVNVSGGPNHGR
ncbi:ribosome maturation protein [Naematelia encephala]|uniref:Ribosome maturation protein n=1 Tax=Naematelia encephala TaxID=71784 RepID=A0A1Y2B6D6_9TREE|nr:ribosome maturation protein [Naematelia encephala]